MNKQNYKVIRILSSSEIVINAGIQHGISENDEFEIYSTESEKIIDYDTDEILGYIPIKTDTVTVISLFDKFCVCSPKSKIKQIYPELYGLTTIKMGLSSEFKKKARSFKVDKNDIEPLIEDNTNFIKKGNIAIKKLHNQN